MGIQTWSQTPASNDTSDPAINLREGQAPRTYNNAVRTVMAMVRRYWDDLSGNSVMAGTATAMTVTSNQNFTSLIDGIHFAARITTTNGADPVVSVDGLTDKQIRGLYGTNIPAGALLAGTIHRFTYDATDDAWIVHGRFGDQLTTAANPDLVAIEALAGTTGALRKTAANTWALDDGTTNLLFTINGNGTVLPTGVVGDLEVPFACTITGVTMLADQSGSVVVDIWKDTYANYPPTVADTIVAAAKPTISAATKSTDATLTGWTTAIAAGSTLRFNIDSVATITRLQIALKVKRFI